MKMVLSDLRNIREMSGREGRKVALVTVRISHRKWLGLKLTTTRLLNVRIAKMSGEPWFFVDSSIYWASGEMVPPLQVEEMERASAMHAALDAEARLAEQARAANVKALELERQERGVRLRHRVSDASGAAAASSGASEVFTPNWIAGMRVGTTNPPEPSPSPSEP